jgi:transposase
MDLAHERHELTEFEKGEIIEGCKFFKQAEVAHDLEISPQTIATFLSRTKKRKSTNNLPRPGAPRKLTNSDVHYLVRTAESETHVPLAEIAVNTTFSNVSVQTLRRRLREEGIRKWKAVGRCLLTNKDAKARYKWAWEHRHLTEEDWAKFAWSDECLIKQDSDPRQSWVFRHQTKCEKYDPKNIRTTLKYGGVKQMIWACFCGNKLGPIAFIDGSINSHVYISVLQDKLLPFFQALHNDGVTDIIFQQDNAKVHTSKLAGTWLKDSAIQNGFLITEWPAYSPDMNPIEELWAHLKAELHR